MLTDQTWRWLLMFMMVSGVAAAAAELSREHYREALHYSTIATLSFLCLIYIHELRKERER